MRDMSYIISKPSSRTIVNKEYILLGCEDSIGYTMLTVMSKEVCLITKICEGQGGLE